MEKRTTTKIAFTCEKTNRRYEFKDEIELATAFLTAKTAQLNPDMPDQELRLHMGELTASEMRVARAAIRWANEAKEAIK